MTKLKIGLDIHGVIDHDPTLFEKLSELGNVEIHIITGIKQELDDVVEQTKIVYDHWFSIHQECEDRGYEIRYDEKGRPWVDEELWDPLKAEYCEKVGIDILIDDSLVYGKYFDEIQTRYLQYRNAERTSWRDDGTRTETHWSFTIKKPVVPEPLIEVGRAFKHLGQALWSAGKVFYHSAANQISKAKPAVSKVSLVSRAFFMNPTPLYSYDEDIEIRTKEVVENDNWEYWKTDHYYIAFKNKATGEYAKFWSQNRMYAFASRGQFGILNGPDSTASSRWDYSRPSRVTGQALYDKAKKGGWNGR